MKYLPRASSGSLILSKEAWIGHAWKTICTVVWVMTAAMILFGFPRDALAQNVATFAPGVDGYNGLNDIYIPREVARGGEVVTAVAIDSNDPNLLPNLGIDQNGAPRWGAAIYQFEGIFGDGSIPLGSEIVSATLNLTANGPTGGDPRVFGAVAPTGIATTFEDLSGLDAAAQGQNSGNRNYLHGTQTGLLTAWQDFYDSHPGDGTTLGYDVSQYIRAVSAGAVDPTNLALVATNNSNDGWNLFTSAAPDPSQRPSLSIEWSDLRRQESLILDNSQITVARLGRGGEDETELITSGNAGADSNSDGTLRNQVLVRFDVDGLLPAGAELQQARLVTVTANPSGDTVGVDAGIAFRRILVDWDLDVNDSTLPSLPSEFGSVFGIQPSEGESTEAFVDTNGNLFDGSFVDNKTFGELAEGEEYVFDITPIFQQWLDGVDNYGIVLTKQNTNAWGFFAEEVQLQLDYTLPSVTTTPIPEPATWVLMLVALPGLTRRFHSKRA